MHLNGNTNPIAGEKTGPKEAVAKVRLEKSGDELEELMYWDVDLYGADWRERSNEITANFRAINLKESDQKFWTDSNGLRMMRRRLH